MSYFPYLILGISLVRSFQEGFLAPLDTQGPTPTYPAFHVTGVDVAHGDKSGVMVQTEEIGSMVLTFDASLAWRFKAEIDRATDANEKRAKPS